MTPPPQDKQASALESLINDHQRYVRGLVMEMGWPIEEIQKADALDEAARKEHEELKEKAWMYDDLCK